MRAIARAAGVHEQTIYLAYGTKAALLAATAARLVAGEEDPDRHPSTRAWALETEAEPDVRAKLARYAAHIVEVAKRITGLLDMLRATAPGEPEVAAFLTHMERGRREGPLRLLGPLAGTPPLRQSLSAEEIADITFALASPDTVRALTGCGWEPGRVEAWMTEQLSRALLD